MGWKEHLRGALSAVFDLYGKPVAVVPGLQTLIEDDDARYNRRVHEAAHVVANHFIAHAYESDWVSVRPPLWMRWGGTRGAFRMVGPDEPGPDALRAQLIVTRAARVGVSMICGDPGPEVAYTGDDQYCRDLIQQIHGDVSPEDEQKHLAEADAHAATLMRNHRDSVIALANRLAEKHTLSVAEIEQTIGWYRWTRPQPP